MLSRALPKSLSLEGNVVNLRVSGAGDEGIAPTGVLLPS